MRITEAIFAALERARDETGTTDNIEVVMASDVLDGLLRENGGRFVKETPSLAPTITTPTGTFLLVVNDDVCLPGAFLLWRKPSPFALGWARAIGCSCSPPLRLPWCALHGAATGTPEPEDHE